jgi:hypothetical protein
VEPSSTAPRQFQPAHIRYMALLRLKSQVPFLTLPLSSKGWEFPYDPATHLHKMNGKRRNLNTCPVYSGSVS